MGDPINLMSWVEISYNHFDVIYNSFLGRKHREILYLVKKSDAKRQRRVGCFCWLACTRLLSRSGGTVLVSETPPSVIELRKGKG